MAEDTNKMNSFRKRTKKEEMKKQLISFALMIGLTIIAFSLVATGAMESEFIILVLIILAVIQVAFQFYYFMHLKDRGNEMPAAFIYGGVFVTFLVLASLLLITWW
ncbi:cytochrome c oxidase subunit IVB [Virgibacillus natechei]|uniref:cytochrome c oxidase subunit IVB n=1 Tax=Virgibacillus sp. CBA3643 TaxID=2942278 RepID=UPI0035A2CEA3